MNWRLEKVEGKVDQQGDGDWKVRVGIEGKGLVGLIESIHFYMMSDLPDRANQSAPRRFPRSWQHDGRHFSTIRNEGII